MNTLGTADAAGAVTRRRFLLVAAAAASGVAASLAGCSAESNAGGPDTSVDSVSETARSGGGPASTQAEGTLSAEPATSSDPIRSSDPAPTSGPVPTPGPARPPQALRGTGARRGPGDAAAARTALTDFGADFLRQARGLDPSAANTAISPYSLFTVLAMARAGAKGKTAAQIDAALRAKGVGAQGAVISAVDAGVTAAIAAAKKDRRGAAESMTIQPVNQTWIQDGFQVRHEYLDALAVQYGIEAMAADFAADPEKMRLAINNWVAERTNDLIPELFPEKSIDPLTVLVLVNALYLKAAWDEPFSKGQPATFHTGDSDILAPTMITNEPVRGVVGKDWSAATIPYLGRGVAMTVLVPALGRFAAVLGALDAGLFDRARADRDLLQVTMPLFSVTATQDALKVAQRLGIRDIFEYGLADLSGIAGRPGDLYAAAFVHQAVVTVDEKGTEAAAATGMTIATMSLKPTTEELIVNRPFIFWISETRTGAPLFLGAVTDPTASA